METTGNEENFSCREYLGYFLFLLEISGKESCFYIGSRFALGHYTIRKQGSFNTSSKFGQQALIVLKTKTNHTKKHFNNLIGT
ncbi:hypothetical protein P5673_021333 [Acropora cervicornis]|uniref:Uncharacterized protein n=1 Tax=Acropora cervicornis TaxID=6130 RepID=A0AAD9V0L0_ACRCE|nr:hypothetical protein P5673_021333 [Acropora cervicornis]